MNRKGEGWAADTMPFYVIFIFIVGMLFLLFAYVAGRYGFEQYLIPEEFEMDVLERRFFADSCFGATDELGRVYTGTLDWDKFKQDRLDSCFSVSGPRFFAYQIQLELKEQKNGGENRKSNVIRTSNWREREGVALKNARTVQVVRDHVVYDGELVIEVQRGKK